MSQLKRNEKLDVLDFVIDALTEDIKELALQVAKMEETRLKWEASKRYKNTIVKHKRRRKECLQ